MSAVGQDVVLEDMLNGRYSCRAFRPEPVPRQTITRLLDLARRTPSWCNTQPWHVHVTEGSATEEFRAALREAATDAPAPDFSFPASYSGVWQERRRAVAWQLYDAVGVERGDRIASAQQAAENFELFGAPHAAVITTPTDLGVYGALDCGLYVGTFLLAAQSLGLAAVPQAALAAPAKVVGDFFAVPDDRSIVCGISFGLPAEDHPANSFRSTRADLTETVSWHG